MTAPHSISSGSTGALEYLSVFTDSGYYGLSNVQVRAICAALRTPALPSGEVERETLIHTICPHIKQWSDAEDVPQIGCNKCPATVQTSQGEGVQMCRLNAEAAADAVLALSPPEPEAYRETVRRIAAVREKRMAEMREALERIRNFPHDKTACEQAMSQIAGEALAMSSAEGK